MLTKLKKEIKKLLPSKGLDYKTLYENERRLRIQLEQNHKAFCSQITAVMQDGNERYATYKASNTNDREF